MKDPTKNIPSYVFYGIINYERSECDGSCKRDNDYCRCTKITITGLNDKIDLAVALSDLGENDLEKALLFMYGKCHITIDDIDYRIDSGYYGEELETNTFSNTGLKYIKEYSELSDIEKLESCLNAENGRFKTNLLKNVTSIKFEKIDRNLIHNNTPKTLNDKKLLEYEQHFIHNESLPVICIVKKEKDSSSYRLIDGRHRFKVFTDKFPKKLIPAIVIE